MPRSPVPGRPSPLVAASAWNEALGAAPARDKQWALRMHQVLAFEPTCCSTMTCRRAPGDRGQGDEPWSPAPGKKIQAGAGRWAELCRRLEVRLHEGASCSPRGADPPASSPAIRGCSGNRVRHHRATRCRPFAKSIDTVDPSVCRPAAIEADRRCGPTGTTGSVEQALGTADASKTDTRPYGANRLLPRAGHHREWAARCAGLRDNRAPTVVCRGHRRGAAGSELNLGA